ncbi:acyl-CoA dehydrogenase family protein [Maricaulis sp.]|uniref:acyl-CoA dehydrogenase family protein n=1 Tax=Maricaulis sp. TaxID=1486257 RepID=UPI001B2BC0F4|nr:acyl-CoA dehydrogenase [Maricaulis sp.]MBO6766323.1 acyl-CoA dehydrogenase [Maricaulis sp.]
MAVLNEEQSMLRDMARDWANEQSPVTAFRKVRDAGEAIGFDPKAFAAQAEMGWTGVIIPEAYGGSDFGYLSLGLVLEETGRTLTASPLGTTALAATSALLLAGSEAQKQAWLPKIASGDIIAALAVDEGPRHDPSKIATKAEKSGDGWTLSGTKKFVAEGDGAHLFVVAAQTGSGIGLFLVPADAKGVSRAPRNMVDARSHAEVRFDAVRLDSDALIGPEDGAALLDQVLDRARAGVAAEMLGLAVQAFDDTLAYLKTREQFGEILSRFQALQHRMAHQFTQIELMRSVVEGALEAVDANRDDIAAKVSLAKATACDTLHLVSREMIQLHGGIGMTDEHHAGFYIKRARVLENAWGNAAFHRERFARLAGY